MPAGARLRRCSFALGFAAAMGMAGPASGQAPGPAPVAGAEPALVPALEGVFEAFDTYPLVGIGDRHGLTQGHMLYESLVRDPRFAERVGNVVVEFGGASQQAVIDRYVNGGSVSYQDLRRVWTDTVGWIPTVEAAYYAHFFYQVRQTNLALPPERRIKVWLGEPPIDWSRVTTQAEWLAIADTRDRHAAGLVASEILGKGKKALIIYGAQHFEPPDAEENALYAAWRARDREGALATVRNLQKRVEDDHPGSLFVAQIYVGFEDANCTARFEQALDWAQPVMATRVLGTGLESRLRECLSAIPPSATSAAPADDPKAAYDAYVKGHPDDHVLFEGDAVLFLAPAEALTLSPRFADFYLDEDYQREIRRRFQLILGQELPADYGRNLPPSLAYTGRDR